MPDLYIDNAGSNTSTYDTWAKAATTLATAAGADAAGDSLYIASTHTESAYGATTTMAIAGTLASPSKLVVGTTAAAPPTTIGSGVVISTGSGAYNLVFSGVFYADGLILKSGVGGSSSASIQLASTAGNAQHWRNSEFWNASSATGSRILIGGDTSGSGIFVKWTDCNVKFANASQKFQIYAATFHWDGGALVAGSSAITTLLELWARNCSANICSVDLSGLASTAALVNVSAGSPVAQILFRNCKLPASWTGTLFTGTIASMGTRIEMHNCDSADTNYRLWVEDYAGSIVSDTGVYNDAGATDGTTRLSWKMETSANAEYPAIHLISPEIVQWNETTGSSKTVTVEIVHNSQGSGTNGVLNDDECWLEVMYLGTSGYPLGAWITDCKANVLATAAAQDTSSAAWTGDSAGWDTQKLAVAFTPQEKGFIHARVVVAKASATVYVDPLITVT